MGNRVDFSGNQVNFLVGRVDFSGNPVDFSGGRVTGNQQFSNFRMLKGEIENSKNMLSL